MSGSSMTRLPSAASLPLATSTATARQTSARRRSRLRTPASRVYAMMIRMRPFSPNEIASAASPCSLSCFGMRWFWAMWTFSSNV